MFLCGYLRNNILFRRSNIQIQKIIWVYPLIVMQIKTFQQTKQDTQTCTEASLSLTHEHPILGEEPSDINNEEDSNKFENKIKYRKLKQKLNNMSFNHDDKSITIKDFSSPKKQRIMKLALDFEKMIKQQNRDYSALQILSKEIYKCLETKSESDLQLLRQSRFIPAFFELLQKIPSLHRTQFSQLLKVLETWLRILHNFASICFNRDYLILTNRANTLISFIIWLIAKEERKIPSTHQLNIIHLAFKLVNILFLHKSKEQDTITIIETTVQLIICSQVFKKIRYLLMEQFLLEQTLIQTQTIVQILKFMLFIIKKSQIQITKNKQKQPIVSAGQPTKKINQIQIKLIEFLIPFLINYFIVVCQTQSIKLVQLQGLTYPLVIEQVMMMTLKLINCCFMVSPSVFKKNMAEIGKESYFNSFLQALRVLTKYCKRQIEEYSDNNQIVSLLNEIIIFIGYISLQDQSVQKKLYQTGIAEEAFNLPVQYIMDSNLRDVYIPTFCCLILDSKINLNLFLKDNSPQPILKMLKKQMSTKPSLTKKGSTSSLMSLAIKNDEYHSLNFETQRLLLEIRFPEVYWQLMSSQLEKHI